MRPVVVAGWGQVTRHPGEPLEAWAEALRRTGVDPARIDSLDVLYCQSWQYDDPPARLAAAVGASPRRCADSGIGGTTPLVLLADAAERIARGEADVCAVAGGEALASVRAHEKAGERPPWSHRATEKRPFPFEAPFHPSEVAHQVFQAYTTFAVRDAAWRARRGVGAADHRRAAGELFASMTAVAAANEHAWSRDVLTPEEVAEPTPTNRMVAFPYTKRLMSNMDVDVAAAVVLAGADVLPGDVFVRSAAGAHDPDHVAEHDELWRSPAMAAVMPRVDDIDVIDLYTCFPSAVCFALDALDLSVDDERAPFTVTGGLPYAGGPGSCYALGSTAAMAGRLRAGGGTGLLTGIGMHLSKHATLVLSTEPGPFERSAPDVEQPRRPIVDAHDGAATVAAFTVHHGRDGAATDALLVCEIDGGARCYAVTDDADLRGALEGDEEWVGRRVVLAATDGVNRVVGPA